jgi:TolA-binding protein
MMNIAITVALIAAGSSIVVGLLSFAGVVVTNNKSNNKMHAEMKTAQAVTDERINELTREVRSHNNFAQRMPVVEAEIHRINGRIKELEGLHKREA